MMANSAILNCGYKNNNLIKQKTCRLNELMFKNVRKSFNEQI